jgi:hypothetical protein
VVSGLFDACAEEAPARRAVAVAAPAVSRVRRVVVGVAGVVEDVEDCSEPEIALSLVRSASTFGRFPSTISPVTDARAHTLVASP